jgi:hypothetical protein
LKNDRSHLSSTDLLPQTNQPQSPTPAQGEEDGDQDDDEDIIITTERADDQGHDGQQTNSEQQDSNVQQQGQQNGNMAFPGNFNMMGMPGMDMMQGGFMPNMMGKLIVVPYASYSSSQYSQVCLA